MFIIPRVPKNKFKPRNLKNVSDEAWGVVEETKDLNGAEYGETVTYALLKVRKELREAQKNESKTTNKR